MKIVQNIGDRSNITSAGISAAILLVGASSIVPQTYRPTDTSETISSQVYPWDSAALSDGLANHAQSYDWHNVLTNVLAKLVENTNDLPSDFETVFDEHFWDLI